MPGRAHWLPTPAASLVGASIEAAYALTGRFGQGLRLVELAGLRDPTAVGAALAGALGLTVAAGSAEATLPRAGALDLLVAVDNCSTSCRSAGSRSTSCPGPCSAALRRLREASGTISVEISHP